MNRDCKIAGLMLLCLGIGTPLLLAQESVAPPQFGISGADASPAHPGSFSAGLMTAKLSENVGGDITSKPEEEKAQEDVPKTEWGGYISAGFFGNTCGAHWNGNANTSSHNGGGFDAIYLNAYKAASLERCGVDFGWGVDFAFGEDTRFMRTVTGWDEDWITGHDSKGNETYGFAMPQIFGEMAVNAMKFQFGHFYTPLGYELIKTSDRYFYSRGCLLIVCPQLIPE